MGKLSESENEILFLCAPNTPSTHWLSVCEFALMHFRPRSVLCFDVVARGRYAQNFDALRMPLLRKICVGENENDSESDSNSNSFSSRVLCLETANLISSMAAMALQKCVAEGLSAKLFVAVSDLDYLPETLCAFANVLIDESETLRKLVETETERDSKKKKKESAAETVRRKCAKYANANGHLMTGRAMFC